MARDEAVANTQYPRWTCVPIGNPAEQASFLLGSFAKKDGCKPVSQLARLIPPRRCTRRTKLPNEVRKASLPWSVKSASNASNIVSGASDRGFFKGSAEAFARRNGSLGRRRSFFIRQMVGVVLHEFAQAHVSRRRSEISDCRFLCRVNPQELFHLRGLRIDPGYVAAWKNVSRFCNRAGEAVAGVRGRSRIVEVRRDEIGHQNTVNRICVFVRLTRIAGFHQIFELSLGIDDLAFVDLDRVRCL